MRGHREERAPGDYPMTERESTSIATEQGYSDPTDDISGQKIDKQPGPQHGLQGLKLNLE